MSFRSFLTRRGRLLGGLVAVFAAITVVAVAYAHEPSPALAPGAVEPPAVPVTATAPEYVRAPSSTNAGPFVLSHEDGVSRYAPILRRVPVRARPSGGARVIARLDTRTPEGSTNIVLLLRRVDRHGALWVQVRLPVLPNNTTGWVPRSALGGYFRVNTHLVVDTVSLHATLYRNGRAIFSAPVGIGKPGTPTPKGEFYVRNELTKYADAFYGPVAFGTSARSAVLTDWPAGGFVGIHGTNAPAIIPGRVSHGCIRLRNGDILRLARLMRPGTPITVS